MVDLDRQSLAEPVRRARVELFERTEELGRMQGRVASLLAATVADQVVGPWQDDDGWHVAHVLSRTEPLLEDDQTRRRAEAHLLGELLAARSAGRTTIRWP
jgi:hypothetical protein